MRRTGVLSDEYLLENCVDEFPVRIDKVPNIQGARQPSAFVNRAEKGFRAPPQLIPLYVAENGAGGTGEDRELAKKLILDDIRQKSKAPGDYNAALAPPPLLRSGLVENLTDANLPRMLRVQKQMPKNVAENIPGLRDQFQPQVVSRLLALGNVRTPVLTGAPSQQSASTTSSSEEPPPMTPTQLQPQSMETPMQAPMRLDPAVRETIRSPWYSQTVAMMERTVREMNNPFQNRQFEFATRRLRSGATQETGMGVAPGEVTERHVTPATGQPGTSQIVNLPPVPKLDEEQKYVD